MNWAAVVAGNQPQQQQQKTNDQPAQEQQPQQQAPSSIPGGSVQAHEGVNYGSGSGHTVAKHVGRTVEQLRERLADEPNIPKASTYETLEEADSTVSAAIEANQSEIETWLNDPNAVPRHRINHNANVGKVLARNAQTTQPGSKIRVILQKPPNGVNLSYVIVTSFPE
jgi:hypothetical protein